MKKIVTFVLPIIDPNAQPQVHDHGTGLHTDEGDAVSNGNTSGGVKLEAVVSDGHAKRIMTTILDPEGRVDPEQNLDVLLRKQLEEAGPDADDLFNRIIVGIERRLISHVYIECDRVKTLTAARLGINRNTLLKKLREFHLINEQGREGEAELAPS